MTIKKQDKIKAMKEGGKRLAFVFEELVKQIKPGITTAFLDKLADNFIKKQGGKPSFKKVSGYKWATCMCVNDCVVHGIPGSYQLKENDILGIDVGMFYEGYHTDMARTLRVQNKKVTIKKKRDGQIERFLKTGQKALENAISQARVENRIGHISKAIQETVESAGFSVVKTLVGHGIGCRLHETPQIPCFVKGKVTNTPLLKEGMSLAIEVIYNLGGEEVVYKNNDGWTIITSDGCLSGLFEDTILVTKKGPEKGPVILTKRD